MKLSAHITCFLIPLVLGAQPAQAEKAYECIVVPQAAIVTDMPAGLDEFE
ncbi:MULTISPECIES: hypothetical protein [Stenotrophomonas]|nr:hypothetical protein [Stenotrophomonas sp.]